MVCDAPSDQTLKDNVKQTWEKFGNPGSGEPLSFDAVIDIQAAHNEPGNEFVTFDVVIEMQAYHNNDCSYADVFGPVDDQNQGRSETSINLYVSETDDGNLSIRYFVNNAIFEGGGETTTDTVVTTVDGDEIDRREITLSPNEGTDPIDFTVPDVSGEVEVCVEFDPSA